MDHRLRSWVGMAVWLVLLPATGSASAPDALIEALRGEDERARAEARQLLPYEDITVVPELLPVLADERAVVWRAAFNVLADFANAVSVPGREADRAEVTAALMTLVAPEQPDAIKRRGLRLLPLVVPEGHDVGPVARLLKDSALREKARAALQGIGTSQARAALRKHLGSTDPDFTCALLDALGACRDEAGIPAIRQLAGHSTPKVRAAAARAMAWTADPAHVPVLRTVFANADAETRFEAADALLSLADAIALAGRDRAVALDVYRDVLENASNASLQGAAIVSLGRFGDARVVPRILTALKGENGRDLEPAVLAAFERLQGSEANRALLQAYPAQSDDMRLSLLGVFGRKQDAVFLELLSETVRSGDPTFRRVAIDALVESQLPAAVSALLAAAHTGSDEQKAAARDGLWRLADGFGAQGDRTKAGQAFLTLYREADSTKVRRRALEGIRQFPIPEAFGAVKAAIDATELRDVGARALAGVADALVAAGRAAQAREAVELLAQRAVSTDAVNDVLAAARKLGGGTEWAHRLGFVTAWSLVGPFPWSAADAFGRANVHEPDIDLNATYTVGDRELKWTRCDTSDVAGLVNLVGVLGSHSNVTAYAVAHLAVSEDTDAVLRVGTDDGVKVWVNGKAVHENNVNRGVVMDQDQVPVKLGKGTNTILIQVTQGGGGWGFCVRVTRPDGIPLPFRVVARDG